MHFEVGFKAEELIQDGSTGGIVVVVVFVALQGIIFAVSSCLRDRGYKRRATNLQKH